MDNNLEEQIRQNRRNNRALFALMSFFIAAATPSIVGEWEVVVTDGRLTTVNVRSRSLELGTPEKMLIILCVFSGLGVIAQKQLVSLLAIFLKSFGSHN